MKQRRDVRQSGLVRLAAINPVPPSERGSLAARLGEIEPQLPHVDHSASRTWWRPPVITLAVVIVLAVGGVAVAASWGPLSAIGAADRPAEPKDSLSPAAEDIVRRSNLGGVGGDDRIGSRLVEHARLLGNLPDGRSVYALPTSKEKLCIVVGESGVSCHDPLTDDWPITFGSAKAGPDAPRVVWGAAMDDVVSVSFEVGGRSVTVPVKNNLYVWEGPPDQPDDGVSPPTVTFADGTTWSARS